MNNNWFEQGEKADSLYNKKEYRKAEKAYHTLLKAIHKSGELDLFLVSKITLGLLLTYIKTEEYEKAFEIWTSDPEVNIFGLG